MVIGITGYTGFVGSYILKRSIGNKFVKKIYCIGRKKPHLRSNKIKYLNISKINKIKVKIFLNYVIFAAGGTQETSINKKMAFKNTTKIVIDFLKNKKIIFKKFIYFSTIHAEKLTNNKKKYLSEKYKWYVKSHIATEKYIKSNCQNYSILRASNLMGVSHQKKLARTSIVPNCFCLDMIRHNKITLESSGKQERNFITLKQMFAKLTAVIKSKKKYDNQIINISSKNNLKIIDMAQICAEVGSMILKKKIKIFILKKIVNYKPLKFKKISDEKNIIDIKKNIKMILLNFMHLNHCSKSP